MTPTESILLLVGLVLGCVGLAKLLTIGAFTFTLKKQPPAVRLHPELLAQMRSEIVHHAIKRGPTGARPGPMRVGDSR